RASALGSGDRPLAEGGEPYAWLGRVDVPDDALNLLEGGPSKGPRIEWQCPDQQLVEDNPQRIHVTAGIDVEGAHLRLLRTHVLGRSDQDALLRKQCPLRQRLLDRLRDSEVDHLRLRLAIHQCHEQVRWLDVPVDDSLLVGVLDGVTDLGKQLYAMSVV